MGFFDTILAPIMYAVAWIMVGVHEFLVRLGMSEGSGWAWVLAIVGLTIVIRILIIPLFFKQIKAMRGMQAVQPELQALQQKYKNKKDPASRQKMQQEMMELYRRHGTNPFASCLPLLLQMPIFFALFNVLNRLDDIASGEGGLSRPIGPLTQELAIQAENSTLFGAPISETFLGSDDPTVKVVTVVLIIAMCATTFITQRQLSFKNMPPSALDPSNPMARQQKMLLYVLPLVFAVSGVNFPIGVLIYWTVSNLWSMGQQWYTIRNHPTPGSHAYRVHQERIARKRARKGLPPAEPGAGSPGAASPVVDTQQPRGQRQQPVRKDRAKKTGSTAAAGASAGSPAAGSTSAGSNDGAEAGSTGEIRGKDGLTAAERAQKRYDTRAAQRRAQGQQGKKGPNRKK